MIESPRSTVDSRSCLNGPYPWLVALEFALAVCTVTGLRFIVAPYGRHGRAGWGPTVPARVGWLVMESPASLLFLAFYLAGGHRAELVPLILFLAHAAGCTTCSARSCTRS